MYVTKNTVEVEQVFWLIRRRHQLSFSRDSVRDPVMKNEQSKRGLRNDRGGEGKGDKEEADAIFPLRFEVLWDILQRGQEYNFQGV